MYRYSGDMKGSELPARVGRPRSEQAREAVLHAVDDLLLEVGYAAMTMKGIAERAEVGRQTVYRWWATKAEILLEASVIDAREELTIAAKGHPRQDLTAYVAALVRFLTISPAGAAYRALVGEAQHDTEVAALIATQDVLGDSARAALTLVASAGSRPIRPRPRALDEAAAQLVGPVFYWIMTGRHPRYLAPDRIADTALTVLRSGAGPKTRPAGR